MNDEDDSLTQAEDWLDPPDDEAVVGGVGPSAEADGADGEEEVEGDGVVAQAAGYQGKGKKAEDDKHQRERQQLSCNRSYFFSFLCMKSHLVLSILLRTVDSWNLFHCSSSHLVCFFLKRQSAEMSSKLLLKLKMLHSKK